MKNINDIRKTFVRQYAHNDCGVACLCMILNYTGRTGDVPLLRSRRLHAGTGASLLELKLLAEELGLNPRCVTMDTDCLRGVSSPCILHLVNGQGEGHFQVCFGTHKKSGSTFYQMADPARQVHLLAESSLEKQWRSKAALYFGDLKPNLVNAKSSWGALFSLNFFPKVFWVTLPLLNLFIALFGVAISWVLQRGMTTPLTANRHEIIISIIILLLLITLFKSLLSYIGRRILIVLSLNVNEQLVKQHNRQNCDLRLSEIQKIQNAISIFVTSLLADGAIICLSLGCLFYMQPATMILNGIYLLLASIITFRQLPILNFKYAHLNEMAGYTENLLNNTTIDGKGFYEKYLAEAKVLAVFISRLKLISECLGTANVMAIFTYGIIQLSRSTISYGTFVIYVILSYLITAIMPKICNALFVMQEGAEAALQHCFNNSIN